MFKLIFFLIKLILLAVLILILGNWLKWDGKTLSDHIKIKMSQTESSQWIYSVRQWSEHLLQDAKAGGDKKKDHISRFQSTTSPEERISASEKKTLKMLIQNFAVDVTGSHKKIVKKITR